MSARSGRPGGDEPRDSLPILPFVLSTVLPAAAAAVHILSPPELGHSRGLVWLFALFPVFLLVRHLGWPGALVALLWTGSLAVLAEVLRAARLGGDPAWVLAGGVTAAAGAAAFGAGWLRERIAGDAAEPAAGAPLPSPPSRPSIPDPGVTDYFLRKLFEGARRDPPLTLVMLEIDRLSEYEELYGGGAADKARVLAADTVARSTRAADVFGRSDGGWVVLLQGEGLTGAYHYARRILDDTASREAPWKGRVHLNAGIAGFHSGMSDPDELLRAAGRALGAARSLGGNRAVIYRGKVEESLTVAGMAVLQEDGTVREIHRAL